MLNMISDDGSGTATASEERLATRKPMLLFWFAGLLLNRVDDDKSPELRLQKPPRTPRADEPELLFRSPDVSSHSYALPPSPMIP